MAEPLKNSYGPTIPRKIAERIGRVHSAFPAKAFLADVLNGYDELDLMARGRQIARALRRHLPTDFPRAVEILLASAGHPVTETEDSGISSFIYLPHIFFVSEFGLDHFEVSMRAQYELTQRFTAEFSIRAFLDRHQDATLARLREWTSDPSPHVRRLVSEGTRPRLPWASRLRAFQKDPRPVLALLELLKDDPDLYVRRSVANNLNDIGKDHPELLVETARRWLVDATEGRRWLVRHALRVAVKRGDPDALAVLGYGSKTNVELANAAITPARPRIGGTVKIAFTVVNRAARASRLMVDLRVGFVKASGKTSPKVFKLRAVTLGPGESASVGKTISLAQLTTRKHYPGVHMVEAVVNGRALPMGEFTVLAAAR
jgi:3-methyladenine DNA glycosylase AlkC